MVLKNIEDLLERLVEGVFARAFKADLQPVELGRRLIKEADNNRKLDVHGRVLIPNQYSLQISAEDYAQFSQVEASLRKELAASLREYARRENVGFLGPVSIQIEKNKELKVGVSKVFPSYDDSMDIETESHCWLEGQGGVRYQLRNKIMSLGRLNECDIVVDDENISRKHAEFRPRGDSFDLVDLGSTNGCKVNNTKHQSFLLKDGDEISFGPIKLWFRQG